MVRYSKPLYFLASIIFLSNGFKTTVVTNLSSSMDIHLLVNTNNPFNNVLMVGEINVVEMMKEHNSSFGGEGNGGLYTFPIFSPWKRCYCWYCYDA